MITCVVRWSENSVRFDNSYGNWLSDGPNSVRFYLSVRYGMYVVTTFKTTKHQKKLGSTFEQRWSCTGMV